MLDLYLKLRNDVLDLNVLVEERILKSYIAFAYAQNHFVIVLPRQRGLRVRLFKPELPYNDPAGICSALSPETDKYAAEGPFEMEVVLRSEDQLASTLDIVRQALANEIDYRC